MFYQLYLLLILISSITSNDEEKKCRYRSDKVLYPPEVFKLVTGFFCYFYANPSWFIENNSFVQIKTNYKNYTVYGITNKTTAFYLNYTDTAATNIVKTLFAEKKFYNKWEMCARAAEDCCLNQLNAENIQPNRTHPCPALWDAWTCFPKTSANSIAYATCPLYASSEDRLVCDLQSEKYCLDTGWNDTTNYLVCASSFTYRKRHNFHIIVLFVAIALMFPSVVIFLALTFSKSKEYNIGKLAFHRNLIFSIIIKNVFVIMSKTIVILDALSSESNNVMLNNGVPCRVLSFFESASKNLIFTCMSADALFLHQLIVRPFKSAPNMLIVNILIVVLSFIPTTIWMILMASSNKQNCWMSDTESWYQWISDGYKYVLLIVNFLLFVNICRVFCLKAGGDKQNNKINNKSAFKATILLLPLFGIPMLVTGQRGLDSRDCLKSDIFFYTTYILEGAQGIFLALYFCYLNNDVINWIKNCFTPLLRRFGISVNRKRTARRTTGITSTTVVT